jgi:hypothetical protein
MNRAYSNPDGWVERSTQWPQKDPLATADWVTIREGTEESGLECLRDGIRYPTQS